MLWKRKYDYPALSDSGVSHTPINSSTQQNMKLPDEDGMKHVEELATVILAHADTQVMSFEFLMFVQE